MGKYLKSRPKRAIASVIGLSIVITVLTGFAIVGSTSSGGTVWLPLLLWFFGVAMTASLGQMVVGVLEDGS